MIETIAIHTLEELDAFVLRVIERCRALSTESATVIALSGDLGAGKTTFVQTLARHLGVTETVTSPTFIILKQYETTDAQWPTLLHMDAYRIESVSELAPLRFSEFLQQSHTLFCIEWAEKISATLPRSLVTIQLEIQKNGQRIAQVF
ncbi:MAG: tRNA (adenosine(37)-N6)-threonylcarbamoyltransferase complex ATPase subunit type 1 TsaE [Patescibacteria group bacterium]